MAAGVKFKQNRKFNRKMTGYGTSRVVLSDARLSSVVFNWSVINLCTSAGDFTSRQSLFRVVRGVRTLPLSCASTESFLFNPLNSFFLWNSFVCANSFFSPTTVFYLRRLRRLPSKTVMPVKLDSTYSNFFAWLLSSLSGARYSGDTLHSYKVLPTFVLYFKLLEVWLFANEVSERELSRNPSFLSSGWSSGFLPFLNFSLKTTFGLFGVFTTFYPFFLVSRIFVRSGYSLFRVFSASKLLEFKVNYTDHLPYESRIEFSFRPTPALVVRLRGYSLGQSTALKTFTFQMEKGVAELSLGDSKNSRIPYYFYFNEFDFLRAPTFITNFKDRDDRLFQNEILRLFFSWFLLDVRTFVLNYWKQSVSFHLSSPRTTVSQAVFFVKILSEDLIKRWVLTSNRGVLLNNAFRGVCSAWSTIAIPRNYMYNNFMRPTCLMFLVGRLLVSKLWLYIKWGYFVGYFFGKCDFYLFSIKNASLRSLFLIKEKNWLIFRRIFVELYAFNDFFIRTWLYFFTLVLKEFSRKLNLNRLKPLIGIFSIFVCLLIIFYTLGSSCLVVFGVLWLWIFCRYSNWSTGLPVVIELPRVGSFFDQAVPRLVFFRHSWALFKKFFFKFWCSYYLLYSISAVFFRCVNLSLSEDSSIFLLSTWYLKKNSFRRGVFSSFRDCFGAPKYSWLILPMVAYSSFYFAPTDGFWNMFNLSRTAVGGYGWWNSGLVERISRYTSNYYLNRLSTFSYESAHLISAKLSLQFVYGGWDFRVLQLYGWLNSLGMSSIFYQLFAWSLLYRGNSRLCSLNGNLLAAFVHSSELVTRELCLKPVKSSFFTYTRSFTNFVIRVYFYIFSTVCAGFRFFWDVACISFFFLVKLLWFVIVVTLLLFTLQFILHFFCYLSFWVVFLLLYLLLKCCAEFFIFCFADSDSR